MQPGQSVRLSDMSIEVLKVTDGLPSAATFRFSVSLNDSSLVWFRWEEGKYIPFNFPAVGETVTLEGARFTM